MKGKMAVRVGSLVICIVCLTNYISTIILGLTPLAKAISVETINKTQKIIPPSMAAFDQFGSSVSVAGNILAIGAPRNDSYWEDSGAVYIYRKINGRWQYSKKIHADAPRQNGLFGYSISIEGSYLIVGEPGSSERQTGAVHVFSQNSGGVNNWGWLRSISRPDDCHLNDEDRFGSSLSVLSGKLIVGAPKACKNRDSWYESTGAAYLYENIGANFVKKLTAYNGDDADNFGASVSLCDQFAFVGSPDLDNGISRANTGATYVYKAGKNWGLYRFINPQDTQENDRFGTSVSCNNRYAAIGSPGDSRSFGNDDRKGSVYVYDKNKGGSENWALTKKLSEEDFFNADPDRNNLFGSSLSLKDNLLIVGYGESRKEGADQEPGAQIFKLKNGVWQLSQSVIYDVDSSCSTSQLDAGFTVVTDGKTIVIGDMEEESDADNCKKGLGFVEIYTRFSNEINPLSPLYLLLKEN